MRKELLRGLTEDQIAKVKACDNTSDLLQLAKDHVFSYLMSSMTHLSALSFQ